MDAGAEDVQGDGEVIVVTTDPADFASVLETLQGKGFEQLTADVERVADQKVALDKEKAKKVMNIIDHLEELDDVQTVSSNIELPEDYDEE